MKPIASLQPGTDASFSLRTTVHWLQNYFEWAKLEMVPVQHGSQKLRQCFLISRAMKMGWYLKLISRGAKDTNFVTTNTTKPSRHLPLFEQQTYFSTNVGVLDLDSHYTHFRSLKQHWESSRGHSNKPTAGMVGGRCGLLGWGSGKHTCATTTHSMGSILQTHVVKLDLIIEPTRIHLEGKLFLDGNIYSSSTCPIYFAQISLFKMSP